MPGVVGDLDSPIRVTVTPSQSSYFAGEPFSVKITFTNIHSPEVGSSKPSSHGHKRGAHSISSAPLARPPTSPGTPRSAATPSTPRTKGTNEVVRRKGFVGNLKQPLQLLQGTEQLPDLIEQRRKRQLAPKSLSVSISPSELQDHLGVISSPHSPRSFVLDVRTPTTPLTPSPLARSEVLQLASDHPHARKHSVLDGQLSLDYLSPTTSIPPSPYTPSSSTSSFSLALDPIAEGALSPYLSTPSLGSPTIEQVSFPPHPPPPANHVYGYPPRNQPPPPIGIGHPSNSSRGRPVSELILYSYAQLTGTLVLSPVPGSLSTAEQSETMNAIRSALLKRVVVGGGSMDISSSLNSPSPTSPRTSSRHRPTHSRSSSLSVGLLSMLSPTSLVSSISSTSPNSSSSAKWRSTSGYTPSGTPTSARFIPNSLSSPSVFGLGFANAGADDIDPEEPLPTLEVQPAMLAVDLTLAPGESRSYSYTIKLPDTLPPTFKGKSLKFSYEFVVGTCRAASSLGGGGLGVGANSISRVMKVPIRVYNNVSVGRAARPYDLLWPVYRRRDVGMPGTEAKVEEDAKETLKSMLVVPQLPSSISSPLLSTSNTLDSLKDYARSLLQSLPDAKPAVNGIHNGSNSSDLEEHSSHLSSSQPDLNGTKRAANGNGKVYGTLKPEEHGHARTPTMVFSPRSEEARRTENEREKEAEGGLTGCREAVEILTRTPKKASYDVNKDGVKVAVLTFTKSAYRLGETITGVVELNGRIGQSRVLKVSAILESHETLPGSISTPSSAKNLRRSHAESHSSFTMNTLRTTFTLDIPSDASPAFHVQVDTNPSTTTPLPSSSPLSVGGLDWKVRLCLLVAIASEHSLPGAQGVRFRTLNRDGARGEWGSSWMAIRGNAPLEKRDLQAEKEAIRRQQVSSPKSWSQFFVSSLLGSATEVMEKENGHDVDDLESVTTDDDGTSSLSKLSDLGGSVEYDGIIPDLAGGVGIGVDYVGGEEGWREVKLETVECEVPVKVFPGNTAFKALNVVFDV